MDTDSSDLNASRQRRQRIEDKKRYVMLDDGVLNYPICLEPLTIPIFQCENGHYVCSSCCPKLQNKCPSCALSIGHNPCRAMETFLKSVLIPCQNVKYGCTEIGAFGKKTTHVKDCTFAEHCSCPVQDCNIAGPYLDLYHHYVYCAHLTAVERICRSVFIGSSFGIKMNISDKILILRATFKSLLFAVQCFRGSFGVYVTVSCIAPSVREVEQFSYSLVYTVD